MYDPYIHTFNLFIPSTYLVWVPRYRGLKMRKIQFQFLGNKLHRTDIIGSPLSINWRRKRQPTPVLLTGKFHGQRSLVSYSPWVAKSDTTEGIHFLSFYGSFWRRKWQPTPLFLPGESHGRRGLVGYGLWGCKELYMTKQLTHKH